MVNNSTNINKPKERLKREGQQFHQYQQNKTNFIKQRWSTIPPISTKQKKVYQTEIVNNSTNIDKPKESFNSDGQPFLQYQQIKRECKQ